MAVQFREAAAIIRDWSDGDQAELSEAHATLCVHAGIAAADAICCSALGEHAQGDNHSDAIELLGRVRPNGDELARALGSLLGIKTRAGYGWQPLSHDALPRAERAMERLVREARDRSTSGPA